MASKNKIPLLAAAWLLGGVTILSGQAVADAALGPALLREAWAPTSPRFIRDWQCRVLTASEIAAAKTAAAAAPSSAGERPFKSWTDEIAVFEMASIPLRDRDGSRPLQVLASTVVTREAGGPATLAFGADGLAELWVNGSSVFRRTAGRPFLRDGEKIAVNLRRGANDLRVLLECAGTPWKFSCRVADNEIEPGSATSTVVAIDVAETGDLAVTPVSGSPAAADSIQISLLAPGGEILADATGSLTQTLHFSTAGWAEGPVEIRCETRDRWGRSHVSFTPWFKGDARNVARALLRDAAAAPSGPAGDTLRLLATLVRERAGDQLEASGPWLWQTLHPVLLEYLELQRELVGKTGGERPSGFVRIAYEDPTDGSTQFGRVYFPRNYSRATPAPLLVFLHGFNPPNPEYARWWSVDRRHDGTADEQGVVVLEVHGRGNAQYQGPGEQDVLRAIAEVRRRFAVDDTRVYLLGESMGGHGTWRIASRHPNLFAAAAPYFGGWDFRLTPVVAGGFAGLASKNRWEAFAFEAASSFANAESLVNTPLFVSHGDADQAVNIAYSRHAVQQLQRWGFDVRYQEVPGFGHEDLDTRERVVDWLLRHRRDPAPRLVQLRAPDLASARNGWLAVTALHTAAEFIRARAELVTPDTVQLTTLNADAVELTPPHAENLDALHVVWNGRNLVAPRENGRFRLSQPAAFRGGAAKKAGMEGPISDVIAHPFMVVIGTISPDPVMREICQAKADAFSAAWLRWQHVAPRVKPDRDITSEDRRRFSLVLIGGPDANQVAKEFADHLPIHIGPDFAEVQGRRWPATNALGVALTPNPANPDEYLLEVAANSPQGLALWNPLLWVEPFGYSAVLCDWYVKDALRVSLPAGRFSPNSYLAYGVFDSAWTRTDEGTFEGDAASRAQGVPRGDLTHPTPTDERALNAFAGNYELFPGVSFRVSVRDRALWLTPPGSPEIPLRQEAPAEFGLLQNGAQLRFETEPDGSRTALLNTDGQDLVLHRK